MFGHVGIHFDGSPALGLAQEAALCPETPMKKRPSAYLQLSQIISYNRIEESLDTPAALYIVCIQGDAAMAVLLPLIPA